MTKDEEVRKWKKDRAFLVLDVAKHVLVRREPLRAETAEQRRKENSIVADMALKQAEALVAEWEALYGSKP